MHAALITPPRAADAYPTHCCGVKLPDFQNSSLADEAIQRRRNDASIRVHSLEAGKVREREKEGGRDGLILLSARFLSPQSDEKEKLKGSPTLLLTGHPLV